MQVDPLTRPGTSCSVVSTMSSQMAYSIQGQSQPLQLLLEVQEMAICTTAHMAASKHVHGAA